MPRDDDQSLGDQQTYEGGAQPADSSDRSLGDQSTFGGGGESSLSDIGGLTGDADLDMEIVDLSRYEVQETLGKGGMGEVLLATDTRLNRKVAIKRMLGDAAKSQTAVKRFLTEAQSIAALNHFNIVQIHDYGRDKDGPFLIMEYVGGGSLLDKCREGALPLEEAVELTCQLCDGLSKAHDAGIIHRDIKPANVLLTTDGLPKLTDFGLARQRAGDTGQTAAGAVLGTLDFMPPEQRRDATQTDNRSDLWSLAATLYQLVTGEPPRVIDLNDVPEDLRPCLTQALKQKPDDRYQSVSEFRDALRGFSSEVTFTAAFDPLSLAEGQCGSCGAANDLDRQFCKSCGIALSCRCIGCEKSIPVWERFCAFCGADIGRGIKTFQEAISVLRDQTQSLRSSYRHEEVLRKLGPLIESPHPALGSHAEWARQQHQILTEELGRLQKQRTDLHGAANDQLNQGNFNAARKHLDSIPDALRTDESTELSNLIEQRETECKLLDTEIRQRVEARKLNGLLSQVNQLLELQPDSRSIQELKIKLEAREEKVTEKVTAGLEKVRSLRQACRFESALNLLEKMPEDLGTLSSEINDLKHDCAALKLSQLRGVNEQQQKIRLAIAGAVGVLLLIVFGLWIRSSMNASALADAVQQQQWALADAVQQQQWALADAVQRQQWDEALAIDDQHVPALVGSANQRLNRESPDIEGAFADIGLAEQVDSTVVEIKPAKALAHAKRAVSLATAGKIADAEKDLKEAETLGVSDSQLTPVRQLLAAAYLKQAKDGVASGDVAGIRAACDAAERYQVADSNVSRLRASAFKAEGEQKEKSGDLSGAIAAFDEAVKLDSSLGLKTERSVLHVKLGEQAVAKQDYAAAATELDSAVSLDKSATGVVALAGSVAEPVVVAFEQAPTVTNQTAAIAAWRSVSQLDATAAPTVELMDRLITLLSRPVVAFEQAPTVANQTAALAALMSIQSVDAQNEELPVLRKRVTVAVLKRGESAAVNTPDSALKDYETALSLGASVSESASLKGQLATALTARCRQSLGSQDVAKASADYATVMKLDSQAASSLVADLEKLPASVWSQLPASVLFQFPPRKNSIGMKFKLLPGGTFTMGDGNEAHQVTLTKAFEIAVYELTQEQASKVTEVNPSRFKGLQNPVEEVSWNEAVAFCQKLSELPAEKKAGYVYRLPTEAEWEYACRAGTTTKYSFGDSDSELGDYAWYDRISDKRTHPVGQKKPNAWGLYDMHGNVWEWCLDWHGGYPSGAVTDPTGPSSGSLRVLRGGSWLHSSVSCLSANRRRGTPADRLWGLGFRVVRSSIK